LNQQITRIKPNSKGQERFLHSQTPRLAGIAGIGSGKSFIGALKSLLLCQANKGITGYVTAPTYKILKGATIPMYKEIFDYIPGYATFIGGDSPESRLSDGGKIIFRSTDKEDTLRGPTAGFVHMDEVCEGSSHYAFNVLLGRLRQKDPKGGFFPCQIYLTSSPKGLDWVYTEFVMQERPDFEIVHWGTNDNKANLPPSYYETLIKQYGGKFAEQELEGKFLVMQGDCMFDVANLERILREDCRPPKEILEHGWVSIWKEPAVGIKYFLGADCADRGGGGMNCAVIVDQYGEECLEIWGEIPMDKYAELIDKYGRLYNKALAGVEVNGTAGGYIVKTLKTLGYPRLYKRGKDEDDIGYYTSAFNREPALQTLRVDIDRNQWKTHSAEFIREARTFVSKASGKWEHLDGCFDDRVFARVLARQMKEQKQGMGVILNSVKRLATTF